MRTSAPSLMRSRAVGRTTRLGSGPCDHRCGRIQSDDLHHDEEFAQSRRIWGAVKTATPRGDERLGAEGRQTRADLLGAAALRELGERTAVGRDRLRLLAGQLLRAAEAQQQLLVIKVLRAHAG